MRPVLFGLAIALAAASVHAGVALPERLDVLSQRIAENPGDAGLLLRRALLYSDNQQAERAFADVQTAESLSGIPETQLVRGILHYRAGAFEKAQQHLDRFLAPRPRHELALSYRARIHRDAGHIAQAVRDYKQLIQIRPRSTPGYYQTAARLMVDLAEYGPTAALDILDQGIAILGPIPQLQGLAITLEEQQGSYAGALQRMNTLGPATQNAPSWHIQRAELLQADGQRDEALAQAEQAQAILNQRRPVPANLALRKRLEALLKALQAAR